MALVMIPFGASASQTNGHLEVDVLGCRRTVESEHEADLASAASNATLSDVEEDSVFSDELGMVFFDGECLHDIVQTIISSCQEDLNDACSRVNDACVCRFGCSNVCSAVVPLMSSFACAVQGDLTQGDPCVCQRRDPQKQQLVLMLLMTLLHRHVTQHATEGFSCHSDSPR